MLPRRLQNFPRELSLPSGQHGTATVGTELCVSHDPRQAVREMAGLLSSAVAAHHWQTPVPSTLVPG